MKKKTGIPIETHHLTVISPKGKRVKRIVPPTELPSDLVPGEFVMIPDMQGQSVWYVYCDKHRWWSNGRWNLGGSICPITPGMSDVEQYELRRALLKFCGWIE